MTISLSNAFPLSGFVAFGTRKGLLRYRICVPCSKRLPTVRDAFSEALRAQNRLLWYRRDIRYQKPPSMVRTSHVYRERPPDVPNETEESGFGSEIGDFAKNGHLYAPVTAAKQSQSAMDYLELPLNSCRQLWAATKPLQTTANRHKIATKPLQMAADCHRLPQATANSAKLSQAATSYSQTTAEPLGPLPCSRKLCRAYQ